MTRKFRLGKNDYDLDESATALLILLPTLLLVSLFVLWPLLQVFYLSLTNWSLSKHTKDFIGLDNFAFLFKDPNFLKAMKNTFLYAFIKIPLDLVLALGFAMLLDKAVPFRRFFRAAYFAPVIVPIVASALIWIWFYDPGIGPFNQILKVFGIAPLQWLSDERTALLSIIIFSVWRGLGYDILLFLAGLQGISETYIEAARIDGASPRQIFWKIKLPLLSPIVYFVLLMGVINSFKIFTEISVMTPNGGPLYSTGVMVYYIYEAAFTRSRFGRAAAASVVLFLIVLALTFVQKQLGKKSVFYE